ncbi:urease accessory protein UreD [Picosynechococcus sp. PCC 73109]|uniref:urease accessory protein UreD n=1 Tax=Picosynechococcus sp. PCC 73109 TaxID=374982 RepID=UPI0007457FC8|nr:urease accessory protein UreD [Picosynechococcus sp. PCC 73109]AMA09738.1 urease accessory protein ureD [Picosynechococcus sp. PCC 73109]
MQDQQQVIHKAQPWHGKVGLIYGQRQGKTEMQRCFTQAPFRIQRPFYPEGNRVCHTVLLHTAGGIVGGDRLSLDLELHPKSHVFLTTAAANKIYRTNGETAQQDGIIHQAPGSILEYFPQEMIIFDGAEYHQSLRVNLAPGAVWCGWEVLRFGRTARGEKFISGNWRGLTEIWQDDELLWGDRQWLPGNPEVFAAWNGLNNQPVVGSLALVGLEISEAQITELRQTMATIQQGLGGITQLPKGVLCRYRGHSSTEVKRWFISLWQNWRSLYSPQLPTLSRVWQTY